MSKNLVNETAKRYINYTKANAEIYDSADGIPVMATPVISSTETVHYITGLVKAELIGLFSKFQTLKTSHPEVINPNLEINEASNFAIVAHFTRLNKQAIIDSLDKTIRKIEEQTNFQSVRAYDDGGLSQIMAHLFGRYSARCNRATESTKDETLLVNKCIKMLLEIKVKGIAKTNGFNID